MKDHSYDAWDDEDEGGGQGGRSSGEIHFRYRDILSDQPRDDQLSPAEIKRQLLVHKDLHKGNVDDQKRTRQDRVLIKEGKLKSTSKYQAGLLKGAGGPSRYKPHPISLKAQFSGATDKQVIGFSDLNQAETNEKEKEANENRHELRLGFSPKPHAAPKLRRT